MGNRERGSRIKEKRKYLRSSIAILLSVFLAVGNISFPVFAENDIDISTTTDAEEMEVTEDAEKVEEAATATEAVEETEIAFNESKTVNGVKVTVSADKGVFPEGSSLFVRAVGAAEEASVENAVEEERSDDVKVASSYTFDIKVLDADGNEIQPDTTKGTVKVSFATDEADNANLTADIYHIDDDMNVDKLDSDTTTEGSKPAVVAETEGFSYYQVEFTYGEMQYVLPGDSEVRLKEILDYLGISGNVTNVYGSNDSLFSAENRDGEWYVIAHQAFSSNEWLKVTLDGVEMDVEIVVTDAVTYGIKKDSWQYPTGVTENTKFYPEDRIDLAAVSEVSDPIVNSFHYNFYLDGTEKPGNYVNGNYTINQLFGCAVKCIGATVDEEADPQSPGFMGTGDNTYLYHVRWYFVTAANTVTLNNQGATSAGTTSVSATSGQAMPDITVPTKTGYTFGGYFTGTNGSGTQYYKADGTSASNWNETADTTLYAKWTAKTYTVTFDKQSGSGGSNSVTATYGSAMPSIAGNLPTRTGYTFAGYYDATSGGTKYYNDDGSSARTWNKASNTTLYARWTANKYTVTLDRQGATNGSASVEATYGSAMPSATMPTRTGYTFDGYWDAESGGTQYYNADGSSARTWNKASNTTLYAHWTAKTYTVTFEKISGIGGDDSVTATYDSAMPSATMPTRTGYTFDGYWDAESGGTQYYNADGSSARTWNKASNTTLYAHWTAKTYTVTFEKISGIGGDDRVTATYDSAMPSATMPTREGYVFCGYWDTDAQTGGNQYYNADGTSARTWDKTEATTLYARWKLQAVVTTAPNAKDLTYTSLEQELVTAGQVNNTSLCKIQYKIGTEGEWLNVIPKGVLAGNYEVYYKATALDENQCVDSDVYGPVENVKIEKASLTVKPDSGKTKQYGEEDPTFTYSVTGLLGADTVDVLSGALTRTPKGTQEDENVGEYEIVIGSLAAANYDITVTSGVKFKIVKKVPPSNNAADLPADMKPTSKDLPYTAGPLDLVTAPTESESSLDGYTVLYSTDGETWTDTIPQGTEDGPYKVYVKYQEDGNHEAIEGILEYNMNITVDATVDGVRYGTIEDAVAAWNTSGGELVLQRDIDLTNQIVVNSNSDKTLDLNGYKINHEAEGFAINVKAGSLTVKDSTGGNGQIVSDGPAIHVDSPGTSVTIESGKITSTNGSAVVVDAGSNLVVTGGTLTGKTDGINATGESSIKVTGGNISGNNNAGINLSGYASADVQGGTITSVSGAGIEARDASELNISGGSVTSENGYGIDTSSTTPLEITGDASVGGKGVNLADGSVIDISNGITSQTPIKVTTASADAPITTDGNYKPEMADYKEIIKAFELENDGCELTIGDDGNVRAMQSSPYGGITVDGIPVSPANIQYLLPGLDASDVTYTPATDEEPAKFVINGDAEIPEGSELVIPEGMEVTIPEGVTLNNNGDIVNNGTLINNGTITGSGDIANNGNVDNGGEITTTGTVTNSETGTIDNTGSISSAIDNAGELNNAADGTISGAVDNSGELNNAGEISGNITNSKTGSVTNDETGVISGAIDNSGELDNSGEISGKLDNEAGGVVNNAEGGKLSGDVTNAEDGTVNNAEGGNISGDIDNSGEVNNSGLIEGDITNAENGVVNNAEGASILGDVDNSGLLENDGYVFGAVTNEANGIINNNADAEIAGPVENKEGGAINNAEDGVISGDVDNAGEINNDGTISGGVNNSGELENNGLLSGDVDNAGLLENNGEVTGAVTNEAGATLNNNAGAEISGDVDNSGELNNSGSIVGDITNNAGGLINNNDGGDISGNTNNKEGAVVINNSGASINANVDNAGTLVNAGGKTNADVNNATNGMVVTIPEDALDEFKLNEDGSMTLPAGTTVLVGNTLNELPEGGSIGSDGKLTINTTPEEATNGSSSDDNSSAKPATVKPGSKNGKKDLGNIRGFRAGAIDDGSEDKPKKKSNVKDKDSDKQDVEEVEDDAEEEVKSQDTDNSDDTNQTKKESKAYVWWIVIGSILIVGLGFFIFLLFKRRKNDDEEKK